MDEINKLKGRVLEHQSYLYSKDWYVSRFAETGEAIPEDVKSKRVECRVKIDDLRTQIKVLESQLVDAENVQL